MVGHERPDVGPSTSDGRKERGCPPKGLGMCSPSPSWIVLSLQAYDLLYPLLKCKSKDSFITISFAKLYFLLVDITRRYESMKLIVV